MTQNQIRYLEALETARANQARETENYRSNLAKEAEAKRSNQAQEMEMNRANLEKERLNREQWEINKYGSTGGGGGGGSNPVTSTVGAVNSVIRTIKAVGSDFAEDISNLSSSGSKAKYNNVDDVALLEDKLKQLNTQLYSTRSVDSATKIRNEIAEVEKALQAAQEKKRQQQAANNKRIVSVLERKKEQGRI